MHLAQYHLLRIHRPYKEIHIQIDPDIISQTNLRQVIKEF